MEAASAIIATLKMTVLLSSVNLSSLCENELCSLSLYYN